MCWSAASQALSTSALGLFASTTFQPWSTHVLRSKSEQSRGEQLDSHALDGSQSYDAPIQALMHALQAELPSSCLSSHCVFKHCSEIFMWSEGVDGSSAQATTETARAAKMAAVFIATHRPARGTVAGDFLDNFGRARADGLAMSRLFGQETESGVGFRAHHMSKVDTDEGLGPGSERQRKEVLEAQKQLESRSKQKAADPTPDSGPVKVDKNAVTEPGIGKVERKNDTVDDLLGGFGTDRPNLPRILPNADTTPPPDPVRKELTPTSPGKRQRARNMVFATLVTFAVVAAVGVALVKYGSSNNAAAPATTVTVTVTTPATTPAAPTETMTPIVTTAIEALPTVKTSAPQTTAPTTTKSVHSATTATATATQTAPRPTGSAPPGMNLLPDDPHR